MSISLKTDESGKTVFVKVTTPITEITISDLYGMQILFQNNRKNEMDISILPDGIYILNILSGNQYHSLRFFKN